MHKITYRTVNGISLELNVYRPDPAPSTPTPAVLFFSGGGWRFYDFKQFARHAATLAPWGLTAILVGFRGMQTHQVTPIEANEDAAAAFAWVHDHADELGIDPARIVLAGASSGGQIACAIAFAHLGTPRQPAGLILFNPVVDTTRPAVRAGKFGSAAKAKKLSPNHLCRGSGLRTLIFHGTEDKIVPYAWAETFAARMTRVGNPTELIPFAGAGHGFFNAGRNDNSGYEETLRHTRRFLCGLGLVVDTASPQSR
jgi:acetyl esterase/lipase